MNESNLYCTWVNHSVLIKLAELEPRQDYKTHIIYTYLLALFYNEARHIYMFFHFYLFIWHCVYDPWFLILSDFIKKTYLFIINNMNFKFYHIGTTKTITEWIYRLMHLHEISVFSSGRLHFDTEFWREGNLKLKYPNIDQKLLFFAWHFTHNTFCLFSRKFAWHNVVNKMYIYIISSGTIGLGPRRRKHCSCNLLFSHF